MTIWYIANKNVRLMLKNVFLLPLLAGMPLFQMFIMSLAFKNLGAAPANVPSKFIEVSILSSFTDVSQNLFYAPSTLVMFILISSIVAASMLIDEREDNTLLRTLTAPVTKAEVIGGNLLGCLWIIVVVSVLILASSSLLLGINWGQSYISLALAVLCTAYAGLAFAFLCTGLFKDSKVAGGAMSFAVVVMSFLSGGLTGSSGQFDYIGLFTINRWGNKAFEKLMEGQPLSSLSTELLVLFAAGTALFAVSAVLHGRESIYE